MLNPREYIPAVHALFSAFTVMRVWSQIAPIPVQLWPLEQEPLAPAQTSDKVKETPSKKRIR